MNKGNYEAAIAEVAWGIIRDAYRGLDNSEPKTLKLLTNEFITVYQAIYKPTTKESYAATLAKIAWKIVKIATFISDYTEAERLNLLTTEFNKVYEALYNLRSLPE